jgi:hypothetical protein
VRDFVENGSVIRNRAQVTTVEHPDPLEASASVPVAGDYQVRVGVYNEAGELVKEILVTQFSQPVDSMEVKEDELIDHVGDEASLYYKGHLIGVWDGTNQDGRQVPNGVYTVKIDNVDQFGVVESVTRQVTVLRPLSKVQVTIYNEAGEAVRHLITEVEDPQDLVTSVRLSSQTVEPVYGAAGPGTVPEVAIVLSNGVAVMWDGRNDGGQVVANGVYFVEVRAEDGKGGEIVVTREVTVYAQAGLKAGEVAAYPNPVPGGGEVTFAVTGVESLTVRVMVYDVAGELVRKVKGLPGANEAVWDTEDVASGLYIAVVELVRPGVGLAERQVKKILVL